MNGRELLAAARQHWRVTLLAVLMVVSLFALFAPLPGLQPDQTAGDAQEELLIDQETGSGVTNLQWGLQLSGGTSVRAPVHGYLAEGLSVDPADEGRLARAVADNLSVPERDVTVRAGATPEEGSVETTSPNVTRGEFRAALQAAGLDDFGNGDISEGVHEGTREGMEDVIQDRIDGVGLGGANVDILTRPSGEHLIAVEAPNVGQDELLGIITERGEVEVVAHFPENDTYRNETVLVQGDFAGVDPAQSGEGERPPHVPVRVASGEAERYSQDMVAYGFAEPGGTTCTWDVREGRPDDPGRCLLTIVDGEVIYAAGVHPNLAESWRSGTFADRPNFQMETTSFQEAQELSINLRSGALPAELDVESGSVYFLLPSMAEEFRFLSLIVGIVAGLAVAGTVYWRYRDARVAVPMLVTASSEVVILLAFAVIVPIPLNLAHIAGFIAVLGTGVDDLVIIADEIMQRGDIRTDRVFESRFRKAFWVIGVAAATTILAMTPLVALSLGELTGFAIVTIVGVLIGVLITRPAYGNILRILMLD